MTMLIEDYRLEAMLRCPRRSIRSNEAMSDRDITWAHLAQYAVGHIVNGYYSTPTEGRTVDAIGMLAGRYWTTRRCKFDSPDHYRVVRRNVLSRLSGTLTAQPADMKPLVLYESMRTHIAELDIDLSLIIQVLYAEHNRCGAPYVVQKFVVDEDEGVISAFQHLAVAFCRAAFGSLPGKIETLCLMSGHKYTLEPDERHVRQALDYLRLLRDWLPEQQAAAEAGAAYAACGDRAAPAMRAAIMH